MLNSSETLQEIEITRKVTQKLGTLLHTLLERGAKNNYQKYTPLQAQRFVLQWVLGMYEGVEYFEGGLFKKIHPIKLEDEELQLLKDCAQEDWSKVSPSIFGNLFEGALNYTDKSKNKIQKQRHAHGIHFTSERDIRRIILPTIREYWEDKINQASRLEELERLQDELVNYTILDPACGSGNFLYVAYQELKSIEKILLEKISLTPLLQERGNVRGIKKVSPQQFYGMDINPFAVELAKVTLMIGRKVAIDKLGLDELSLPLDQLDDNIICTDALFTPWVKADAIIGNPPFLGGKHTRLTLGDEYVNQLFSRFPDVKDVDFCAYWFRLAHENLGENGRGGLVGTNSISQGKSRKVVLDYITENQGYIYHAVSSQKWSGDAKVYVSIVNWCKVKPSHCVLDGKAVSLINSSLTASVDVTQAVRLKGNFNQCFQGVIPNGKGFIITEKDAKEWIQKDPKNKEVIKLFSMGANLAKNPLGKPDKWIIDFNNMSLEEASQYQLPLARVKATIPEARKNNRNKKLREYWWLYEGKRLGMREAVKHLSSYFTVPRVSKWGIFIPAPIQWLGGDLNVIVASEDYYILGILTSTIHRVWVKAQSSTLGETLRYTNTTCFETFPFPQNPDKNRVQKIRKTAIKLHEYRSQEMVKKGWGITELYNQYFDKIDSHLSQFHQELDQLVMSVYHFKEDDDILEKLLELNLKYAQKEAQGEPVMGAKDPYL